MEDFNTRRQKALDEIRQICTMYKIDVVPVLVQKQNALVADIAIVDVEPKQIIDPGSEKLSN